MKRIALIGTFMMAAFVASAAEAKQEVIAAAKKLAAAENYSYKNSSEGGQFNRSSEGRVAKDGTIYMTTSGRDNAMVEAVVKGDKGAMTNQDGDWQSLAEIEANSEGPGRFRGGMLRAIKAPAAQAEELANGAKELKKEGDVISGDLTEEAAKKLMTFGRGGQGFEPKNPVASVKFWVKDGALSKYQYRTKGTYNFQGEDREMERTTTVEINKVGETKVVVPEAAKKKLS